MFPNRKRSARKSSSDARQRGGLSLIELLVASTLLAIMAGVVGGLSFASTSAWRYGQGQAVATQHARVAMQRITRAVRTAYANPDNPGCAVIYETLGTWRFPDTLVVWSPTGTPTNPDGQPLVSECLIFCPDPADPSQLVEIRDATDTRTIPLSSEITQPTWVTLVNGVKTSPSATKVVLTDLLRTSENSIGTKVRSAIRFERQIRPSESEWTAYQGALLAWEDMTWPGDFYGGGQGLRHVWLRLELQLMPGELAEGDDPQGQQAIPFFSSAALYYDMPR